MYHSHFFTEWLTVANLEENSNTQLCTSNVETADEVEQQQQSTQHTTDGSNGIIITTTKSKKRTSKISNENIRIDNGPLADHYARFDGKFYTL